MSDEIPVDENASGDVLEWLHEQGKRRGARIPEFDVNRTISRAHAVHDTGAVRFWNVLSPTERDAFQAKAHEQWFAAGTALMREGEQADEVIVIVDGRTKVCLDEDGQERLIAQRGPGDLVGEGGTVPGRVRVASVIAISAVRALVMTTADYAAFVADHPGVPDLVKKQMYDRRTDG